MIKMQVRKNSDTLQSKDFSNKTRSVSATLLPRADFHLTLVSNWDQPVTLLSLLSFFLDFFVYYIKLMHIVPLQFV